MFQEQVDFVEQFGVLLLEGDFISAMKVGHDAREMAGSPAASSSSQSFLT